MEYDIENMSTEDLHILLGKLEDQRNEHNQLQYALKIAMNSIYGAFCNIGFNYFNIEAAEAITTQGRSLTKYGMACIDKYFTEMWHLDKELHNLLGIESPETLQPVVIYGDTDSIAGDSFINCEDGRNIKIEDLFNQYSKISGVYEDEYGHEFIDNKDFMIDIKNYDHKSKKIYNAKIKKIVRHKVSKPKWLIRTKGGSEVLVTNDHSMIVIRNGEEVEIKPCEIVVGDKVIRLIEKN